MGGVRREEGWEGLGGRRDRREEEWMGVEG